MIVSLALSALLAAAPHAQEQKQAPKFDTFEVATIKRTAPDERGRYFKMEDVHRFVAKGYTLKLLVALAYDINPRTVSGGPGWEESDRFDIVAITPGDTRPSRPEQMAMLQKLVDERFKLKFHRQEKDFSIYELTVAKSGAKLKPSKEAPDTPAAVISTVYSQRIVLPARNASMADFTSMLQRALLDRPVVDKTGLQGKFDFDLEWAPDETQFSGQVPVASADAPAPPFFTAIKDQLGLEMHATRGPVSTFVIDAAQRPTTD